MMHLTHFMGYSFQLTTRDLLYAPSHRQDSIYHSLCCTICGALAGMRNKMELVIIKFCFMWPINSCDLSCVLDTMVFGIYGSLVILYACSYYISIAPSVFVFSFQIISLYLYCRRKEGNVLFIDTLNIFYLRL